MNKMRLLTICMMVLSLAACGHLRFTDQSGIETGAKIYTAKPYLLVSRTGAKDKPIDVQVVFLPDLKNPTYVKPIAGFGSSDLSITLSNGMLVSFGQKTDPKIAELLSSIGGLTTSLATAQKTRAEARAVEQAIKLEDGNTLRALSQDITEYLKEPLANNLSGPEQVFLTTAAGELKQLGDAIVNPGTPPSAAAVVSRLEGLVKNWDTQIRKTSAGTPQFQQYLEKVNKIKEAINGIINKAKPKQEEPPIITLYEIEIDTQSKKTVLREVSTDSAR